MPRFSARDLASIIVFFVGGVTVVVLALWGRIEWALAALGILVALIGIITRLQLGSHRGALRQQSAASRAARKASEQSLSAVHNLGVELSTTEEQLATELSTTKQQLATELSTTKQQLATELSTTKQQLVAQLSTTRRDVAVAIKGVTDELVGFRADAAEAVAATHQQSLQELSAVKEDVAVVRSAAAGVERLERRLEPDLMTGIQALMQLMARYAPTAPLPLVAGWAVSPAGLLFLADSIERREAELVVECGSGTSTLWMAMAMRRKGSGKVLALEHLEEYAEKTRAVLAAHDLSDWAEVRVCPLVNVPTPRGEFLWYDLEVDSLPREIDILLVDGPPGTTGRHARYPALPRLGAALSERCLIVVDDADRLDEREVLGLWNEEWSEFARGTSPGRGVALLERVDSSPGTDA